MAEDDITRAFRTDELTGWSLTQIGFWPDSMASLDDVVNRVCGTSMPERVGKVNQHGSVSVIRIAPDRCWVVDDAGDALPRLSAAVGRQSMPLTGLTHGRVRFRLTGPAVRNVLAPGVALDLEGQALSPGRASQTVLHRVPVVLHRLYDEAFELYVPRSFAVSISDWIADAAVGAVPFRRGSRIR